MFTTETTLNVPAFVTENGALESLLLSKRWEFVTAEFTAQLQYEIVRLFEEQSVAAINKTSGPYAVKVSVNEDRDTINIIPQNLATLLAAHGVFPRSLNGLDADFYQTVEGAYRLNRNSDGEVVNATFVPQAS